MTLGLAIALAVLQGLTEFLPVSSSGHLRLLAELFGVEEPQTLFDILLHVGTLVAVFFVYRKLFGRMARGLGRVLRAPGDLAAGLRREPEVRLLLLALVGTVPTGLIAILLGDTFEGAASHLWFLAIAWVVNAGMLLLLGRLVRQRSRPESAGRSLEELRWQDALLIGTVQGFGIVRGISRSGSTITAGLLGGLDREAAAAFSFVLSVPAILAALVLKFDSAAIAGANAGLFAVGALVAAIVGTLALMFLLELLKRGKLHHFAWYCLALAGLALYLELAP